MKKMSLLPLLAVVLAFAASAFTTTEPDASSNTALYWFRYDSAQSKFVFDRHSESPTITCNGQGLECAQGFASPNPGGAQIYPGVTLMEELEKTP